MKATGIVRRIDDLGRVVVPKEIRRTLRIREGDPLEIFVDREGEIILKKYSPILELEGIAKEYATSLSEETGMTVLFSDRDAFVSIAGTSGKKYKGSRIGAEFEKAMAGRKPVMEKHPEPKEMVKGEEMDLISYMIVPIFSHGDVIGCVAAWNTEGAPMEDEVGLSLRVAALFIGKQME
ncbi:stage V sporulation T C-terminal domain-containing protein [Salimicrobium halophilum]|uniref:Transcriptional regulator, AbrB family n=1 Tax=Salimicrobium halophilum TaxID=86666 RepID=A0A1G8W4S2_9BACI|nr:stage V sporulation T C-terminal domain-containing protein [Salimicrobium halophilum]SDJ72500.1 transcriptional regulator, AbrB family [Salimicrobium halophilum]